MMRIGFSIGIVQESPPTLAKSPCCSSGVRLKERKVRGLEDIRIAEVQVVRYLCKACGRSFTVRPEGVTQSSKSVRVKCLAVLLYILGLSYDSVAIVLRALGVNLVKSSAYNYVRQVGKAAARLRRKALQGKLRFAGMDSTYFKVKGRKLATSFISDALTGDVVAIDFLNKEDAHSLSRCLKRVAGEELELLISDDAGAYLEVAEQLGVAHQLCQAHAKKFLKRRCTRIWKDTPKDNPCRGQIKEDLAAVGKLIKPGQPLSIRIWKLGKKLYHKYQGARPPNKGQKATAPYRMRLLATWLYDHGLKLFSYRSFKDKEGRYLLDSTNNVTERGIGLSGKIRYRQMRGAKSRRSLKGLLNLNAYLWQQKHAGVKILSLTDLAAA